MSLDRMTDVESKIEEVRQRLLNLSRSFQRDEETAQCKNNHTTGNITMSEKIFSERPINEDIGAKNNGSSPTGSLNRLVALAKREAAQRAKDDSVHLQSGGVPEERNAAPKPSSDAASRHVGLRQHTYHDPTALSQQAHDAGRATSTAAFLSYTKPTSAAAPHSVAFTKVDFSDNAGFDPLRAVQDRLREKLRRSAVSRSPLSSPDDALKSPSPKPRVAWKSQYADVYASRTGSALGNVSPSILRMEPDGSGQRNIEGLSPSVASAAADDDTAHKLNTQFPMPRKLEKALSMHSSFTGKQRRTNCATPHSGRADSFARRPSFVRGQSNTHRSPQRRVSVQRPSRFAASNSRCASPCRAQQSPLPVKTAPQRTVLDVLSGAEVFALMRLRGVLVSRGETGEAALPDTRCHSVYLSPDEHKQLLDLRANLRLRLSSVKAADAKTPTSQKPVNRRIVNKAKRPGKVSPTRHTLKW